MIMNLALITSFSPSLFENVCKEIRNMYVILPLKLSNPFLLVVTSGGAAKLGLFVAVKILFLGCGR